MKYSTIIKDYMSFNQRELRGIIVMITLIFLVVLANICVPLFVSPRNFDPGGFENEAAAFERAMHSEDSNEAAGKKNRYAKYSSGVPFGGGDSAKNSRYPVKPVITIELNAADTFSLQQLYGIGPGYARRIVRYRERLGGFVNKRQVLEVFGMDTARYNGIAANLYVNPDSVHKINLNTVTFKKLLSHPYFPFEITRAIILYRNDKKKISSVGELMNIKGMTDTTFRKIIPYIRIE